MSDPLTSAGEHAFTFTQGAFVVYDPGATRGPTRFLPFRFNPEQLQRQISIEQASGGDDTARGEAGRGDGETAEQAADASSGALQERFSVTLRFDLAERLPPRQGEEPLSAEYGVFPEICALEDLLYEVETEADRAASDGQATKPRRQRPLVLMVWGERRLLPVRITAMTVNEQLFNIKLYPVRAEVEVAVEVLGEADAQGNDHVTGALGFTAAHRRKMARIYLDTTATQGTSINLP